MIIKFEIDPSRALKGLQVLADRLGDLRDVWSSVIAILRSIIVQQFSSQGRGPSGSWRPLSFDYARWKEIQYPGQPKLVATGDLLQGLVALNHPDHVEEISAKEVLFGTTNPVAAYHQYGTTRMPARPIIDLTQQDRQQLADQLKVRLALKLEHLGF